MQKLIRHNNEESPFLFRLVSRNQLMSPRYKRRILAPSNDYCNGDIANFCEDVMDIGNYSNETQVKDLFIFRTNIEKASDFAPVKSDLQRLGEIHSCTIDLEDCDKVLRIESENVPMNRIVEEVARHGFLCEELAD